MAEKKESKKEKKTTAKKTSKKITITYNPIGFNSQSMIYFPLYKKDENGVNKPLIQGLPTELKFIKGQTMDLTQKQYDLLVAEGCVESEEEYKRRKAFIKGMKNQYPKTFSDLEVAEANGTIISAQESQRMIYNDKLIRVD